MKLTTTLLLILSACMLSAQSFPIDFESSITTADFVDFNGGIADVIDNPFPSSINESATVARIIREGGDVWAGSKLILSDNLDFQSLSALSMKVYTTAPAGTTVKFKLEGNGAVERDVQTTVSGEWETLTWDFTGVPTDFNELVFMFDFGNVGDGSETSTFYFDDLARMDNGTWLNFPVDFEDPSVNYTMTDFGGNISSLVVDPTDPDNHVIQAIKTDGAATWAGTTIGTPAGFSSDIPLSLTESTMTVRVWAPEADTPIRLKVEDANDPTHTCETETRTTVGGEWEVLVFDFINQAPGTELLSIGLDRGWKFNMASIFFNFGTEGATVGEMTYYFDDVFFGTIADATTEIENSTLTIYPNPTADSWKIQSEHRMNRIQLFDSSGKVLQDFEIKDNSHSIRSSELASGIYFCKVYTSIGVQGERLVKY